jgi:hypothetical protein
MTSKMLQCHLVNIFFRFMVLCIRRSYTAWSAVVYGKRKCGRVVWHPLVSLVWSVLPWNCLSGNCGTPHISFHSDSAYIYTTTVPKIHFFHRDYKIKISVFKYLL